MAWWYGFLLFVIGQRRDEQDSYYLVLQRTDLTAQSAVGPSSAFIHSSTEDTLRTFGAFHPKRVYMSDIPL